MELVVSIAVELARNRIDFEQTVDGSSLLATAFAHAFCGSARWRREADAFFHLAGEVQNPFKNCRLTGAGATCDDGNLSRERHLDCAFLDRVKAELVFAFPICKSIFEAFR